MEGKGLSGELLLPRNNRGWLARVGGQEYGVSR